MKKNKIKRSKRVPNLLHPFAVERTYMKRMDLFIELLTFINKVILFPALPEIIKQYDEMAGRKRRDAYPDDLNNAINNARTRFYNTFTDNEIGMISANISSIVDKHNKTQTDNVFKAIFGQAVYVPEGWKAGIKRGFVDKNIKLIKSTSEVYFKQIGDVIERGIKAGASYSTIAEQMADIKNDIGERLNVTESNLYRIARDQVSKLNGELTHLRQTSIGITEYIWRTQRDNRVRDEHADREGIKFSWDAPPEDGHPGEAINCRCWAEAVLTDAFWSEE